ncbi:hypothetical protein D0T84_16715 [Dysgonomonas sp. 521]|nr:hypothetical protein [Dysgonomonas sp. 521]
MFAVSVNAQTSFTLNKEGVGCLKKGMLLSKVPAKCAGLYDRFEKKVIEDEMDGDYTIYSFYLGKEKVAEIPDYGEKKIGNITVFSSNVSTPGGVKPGMLIRKLLAMTGVKGDYRDGLNLVHRGYTINFDGMTNAGEKAFNDAYAKGTNVRLSNACFKADAKVVSISY